MEPLTFFVHGLRWVRDESQALYLDDEAPSQALRLALPTRGSDRHIFPALALDDWGRERKGPGLYRWLYDEGPRFPRAELFGFDAHGREIQIFLRDLELSFAYPCYIYEDGDVPVHEGQRLEVVFLPEGAAGSPTDQAAAPEHLPWPLRRAAVRWRSLQTLHDDGWQRLSG